MAIIPDFYKEATVTIGIKNGTLTNWIATGFLVGRYEGIDSNGKERYSIYLITNKHVVDNLKSIDVQYNYANATKNLSYTLIGSDNTKLFSEHPNLDVDVVAIRINVNDVIGNGIKLLFFSLKNNSLNLQDMKKTGVGDGAFVYVLGFPVGISQTLVSNLMKEPVCRMGCIAKIDYLYHKSNNNVEYLIDCNVFPGNSGGPVISRPEQISLTGTPTNSSSCLIGIVGAYLPYQDILYSRQTNRDRMITEENSGLGVVYPVDYILETVELERTRTSGLASNQQMKLP